MKIHLNIESNDYMIVNLITPPIIGDKIELCYDPDEPMPEWIIECDSELWRKICEDGFVVTDRRLSNYDRIECSVKRW